MAPRFVARSAFDLEPAKARNRPARGGIDQRHHDDRNRPAGNDSARHRGARRSVGAGRLDRRRNRRALRRLGLGGALIALPRLGRNVRLLAQRFWPRSARQGARVPLQLAVSIGGAVPARERLHRICELCSLSLSRVGDQRRRPRRGRDGHRAAHATAALSAHGKGGCARRRAGGRGGPHHRARRGRRARASARPLRARTGRARGRGRLPRRLRERALHHALRLRRLLRRCARGR